MANITVTTAANFIPEIWSMEVQKAAESALVFAPLVTRFDRDVSGYGDTIHIPNLANLTTNPKTANADVTPQAPTESVTNISIDTHEETSFYVEDIAKVQSRYDLLSLYTQKSGYAIAQKVDSDIAALYSSLTSTDVGTYGTDITDAVLISAIESLNLVDAPQADRYFVMDPSQQAALMKLDRFTSAYHLGDVNSPSPVQTGGNSRYLWGEVYGIPFYVTNQVAQTTGTPTQTHNILFHKEAFALAMQQSPRTQADYQLQALSTLVVVDVIYGVSIYRPTFGVEVKS